MFLLLCWADSGRWEHSTILGRERRKLSHLSVLGLTQTWGCLKMRAFCQKFHVASIVLVVRNKKPCCHFEQFIRIFHPACQDPGFFEFFFLKLKICTGTLSVRLWVVNFGVHRKNPKMSSVWMLRLVELSQHGWVPFLCHHWSICIVNYLSTVLSYPKNLWDAPVDLQFKNKIGNFMILRLVIMM